MARKQAQRRKQKKARNFRMPSIPVARIVTPAVAILIVVATYHVSGKLLDRPIDSIAVNGPFQRVTALQVEEAISDELDAGFFGADVGRMQRKIQALTWIDGASVARRWPSQIAIAISEQVPAAIWGESGLLNVRGELANQLTQLNDQLVQVVEGFAHRRSSTISLYFFKYYFKLNAC